MTTSPNLNKTETDFSTLSAYRLGQAFVRMNGFQWDDICGPKPEGFDEMTNREKHHFPAFRDAFEKVEMYLTPAQRSMFWWTIELGKTYEQWHEWYYSLLKWEREIADG